MARGNTSERRGKGFAPSRVTLPAELGKAFRDLAAALDLLESAATGDVGDGEELARRLAESYQRRPAETLAALSPLLREEAPDAPSRP